MEGPDAAGKGGASKRCCSSHRFGGARKARRARCPATRDDPDKAAAAIGQPRPPIVGPATLAPGMGPAIHAACDTAGDAARLGARDFARSRHRPLAAGGQTTTLRAMQRFLLPGAMILTGVVSAAGPALAHPHVWIDAGVEVLLDDRNRATGLRIRWTYDDLYSLYVVGDMGLDPDWDGALTPAEEARLAGFDMNWDPGFPGDTYALLGEAGLDLLRPQDWTASYAEGRITTTHVRRFAAPVPVGAAPLVVQVYDPGYYVAYSIPFDPVVTGGRGCAAQVFVPDLDAAQTELLAALSEYTPDVDLEAQFPAVGANFAEEVRVTCPAP